MLVYVVEWWSWAYETGVSAVFSTEDLAQKWIDRQDISDMLVDGFNIEEYEMDNPLGIL